MANSAACSFRQSATPWNQYGAYIGISSSYAASLFDPAAIKVNYTRFHVHKPSDDNGWSYFPFTALKATRLGK